MAGILSDKNVTDDNVAKQTLLLHATKGDLLKQDAASLLFYKISLLNVESELDDSMKYWSDLGQKLYKNDSVS